MVNSVTVTGQPEDPLSPLGWKLASPVPPAHQFCSRFLGWTYLVLPVEAHAALTGLGLMQLADTVADASPHCMEI